MKKTLHIFDTSSSNILHDGPSMLVTRKGKAPFRIPYEYVDFLFLKANAKISNEILKNIIHFRKPVVITDCNLKESLHIIPYYDSGYFFDVPQRLAVKKVEIKQKVHMFMLQVNKDVKIAALNAIDQFLGKCYKYRFLRNDEYEYYIEKHAGRNRKKIFYVKKHLRDFFMGLINARCIEKNFDVNTGIINENRKLGFAMDICTVIEPVTDILALKFFEYKQAKLWVDNELTEEGIKLIAILFEQAKPTTSKLIERILEKIKKIIYK